LIKDVCISPFATTWSQYLSSCSMYFKEKRTNLHTPDYFERHGRQKLTFEIPSA